MVNLLFYQPQRWVTAGVPLATRAVLFAPSREVAKFFLIDGTLLHKARCWFWRWVGAAQECARVLARRARCHGLAGVFRV